VRELAGEDQQIRPLVEPLLSVLATMLTQLAGLTRQVLTIVRQDEVSRRLMTVPGVGPIIALAYRATIDRPDRFRRSREVGGTSGPDARPLPVRRDRHPGPDQSVWG
jgi:transposase